MLKKDQHRKSATSYPSAIDSVSASELLKALHTLENIHLVQQQPEQNMNISFSQKDNFNENDMLDQDHLQKRNNSKLKINDNNGWLDEQVSATRSKAQGCTVSKTGKMNFEFYMSKKQTTKKYVSKSPLVQKSQTRTVNDLPHKQINQIKVETRDKQISPLTERSGNFPTQKYPQQNHRNSNTNNKQLRLKTQVSTCNGRQSIPRQSISAMKRQQLTGNKQNKKSLNIVPQSRLEINKEKKSQKNQSGSQIHLSIHERNKEFVRLKNEKLAKLSQQIQDKKKQEDKQCTFKPKFISNNSHVKSKYNDLCASREFYDKHTKRCRVNEGVEDALEDENFSAIHSKWNHTIKDMPPSKITESKQRCHTEMNQTVNFSVEQSGSRLREQGTSNQNQSRAVQVSKPKYRNAKFNILLDLIH